MYIRSFLQYNESTYFFAIFLRWNACHLHILHTFQFVKELFNLSRIDIFATTDNHIFDASGDAVIAVFIFHAKVTGVKETVLVDYFGCGLRILIVTLHVVIAPVAHFALHAHRTFFSGFGINHHDFCVFEIVSYGIATNIKWVVNA